MKQSVKSNSSVFRGKEGFEQYYKNIYGDRWEKLKESFSQETQAVEYKVNDAEKSYFLDAASVLAASCLPLIGAEKILDLCAAPGGKSLVLASRMEKNAVLFSNERSSDRKKRLSNVIQTCLPPTISERVEVSCSDGSTWCTRQSECFERIILDAPCSSERHVFNDEKYLNIWSASRIKTVTMEQWALLSSAYRLLEVDGILLYSTCALCPEENDGMIERLYKKFNKENDAFSILSPEPDNTIIGKYTNLSFPEYEKTKYGNMIFPDAQKGAGPIYFTIIKKNKSLKKS